MRLTLTLAAVLLASPLWGNGQTPPLPPGEEQKSNTSPAIISRTEWGAQEPDVAKLELRRMGEIRFITIHHTESPSPDPIDETVRLRAIQRGHMIVDHQWGDIAYHFLIGPSGKIYEGRSVAYAASSGTVYLKPAEWSSAGQNEIGQTTAPMPVDGQGEKARTPGATDGHLTICFIGNFEKQLPTPEARKAMVLLVAHHLKIHSLTLADVLFHREVACWTDCPGQTLYDWFRGSERKRGATGEGLRLLEAEWAKIR